MNATPHNIAGVPGILTGGNYANGRQRQAWRSEGRPYAAYDRPGALIHAEIRFDNEFGNVRSSFSLTASLSNVREMDRGSIGCAHESIVAAFPELANLVRWHMAGTAKPWSYDSAPYFAGDCDHNGKRAGEPWAWHEAIRFGSVPMLHRISKPMAEFLREVSTYEHEGQVAAMVPIAVAHGPSDSHHKYSPKYQFAGEPVRRWHECAFDTEGEAERFAQSFVDHGGTIERIPHLFSEGKARELDLARGAAIWPDATDEELTGDTDTLRATLAARLPGIMATFQADIAAAGLQWPAGSSWGER